MKPTAKLSLRDNFFGEGSVEVTPPPPGAKEGGIRRLAVTADKLLTQPSPDVNTLPDVLEHAVAKYPQKNAVGWRDIVRIVEEKKVIKKVVDGVEKEETKTWKYFELSDPKYLTFPEYRAAVREVAKALVSLGIKKDNDVINIYAQTRCVDYSGLLHQLTRSCTSPNWQLISQACALISTPIATSYETLGEEGLTHSLNEPNCRAVFTNADLLPMLLKVLPNTPSIDFVFYDGEPKLSLLDQIASIPREGGTKIAHYHIDALRKMSTDVDDSALAQRRPSPDSDACIMYTSGSTGKPKGVVLSHGNLVASLASVHFLFGHHLPEDTVYLAYLPLAHVFEYIVELVAIYIGATAVYARPKTLTDQSVRNCKGDLTVYRPTVMLGVPAVWEQIRKGITGKLEDMGWVAKTAVGTAMATKKLGLPVVSWLMDKYVLSPVRQPTGGNLRWAINGGAAISKDTQEFLSEAVVPLMQGAYQPFTLRNMV